MKRADRFLWLKSIGVGLCLILFMFSSVTAESKPKDETESNEDTIVFLNNFEPPGDDKPKDTGAGGSRDGLRCNPEEQPIHALMPQGNFGLTFKQQPNIYLYLAQTSATQVVLAFQDEAGTEYDRAFLPIEINNNIASFSLPKNKLTLKAGKNYQWKISVICGEHPKPGDPSFSGWVQRVESTEADRYLADNIDDKIRFLAEQGYWYDLLDAISLRQRSANAARNSLDDWQQVLKLNN